MTVESELDEPRRHVIVTGASRGLGLAFVEALLDDGFRVSACSRRYSEGLEWLSGEDLFWRACDVGSAGEVADFVDAAVAWAGEATLWALINNAAILRVGATATAPLADAAEVIGANLTGAIHMARAFLRHKLADGGPGRIVNISSILGQRGFAGIAAYSASKAGLDGLTRSLARELGPLGITVNTVSPGYIETEMISSLNPSERAGIISRTPVGRVGAPADIVPMIRLLLSREAGFVTGQTIVVDGGISV